MMEWHGCPPEKGMPSPQKETVYPQKECRGNFALLIKSPLRGPGIQNWDWLQNVTHPVCFDITSPAFETSSRWPSFLGVSLPYSLEMQKPRQCSQNPRLMHFSAATLAHFPVGKSHWHDRTYFWVDAHRLGLSIVSDPCDFTPALKVSASFGHLAFPAFAVGSWYLLLSHHKKKTPSVWPRSHLFRFPHPPGNCFTSTISKYPQGSLALPGSVPPVVKSKYNLKIKTIWEFRVELEPLRNSFFLPQQKGCTSANAPTSGESQKPNYTYVQCEWRKHLDGCQPWGIGGWERGKIYSSLIKLINRGRLLWSMEISSLKVGVFLHLDLRRCHGRHQMGRSENGWECWCVGSAVYCVKSNPV